MRMIREKVSRRALWAIFGCRWRSGPPTSDMTSDWVVINVVSVVGHVMSLGVKMTANMVGMMLMMDSEWVVCCVVGESAQYLPTVCTHLGYICLMMRSLIEDGS